MDDADTPGSPTEYWHWEGRDRRPRREHLPGHDERRGRVVALKMLRDAQDQTAATISASG